MGGVHKVNIVHGGSYDNSGRIKIVIERFSFSQEFRAENYVFAVCLLADGFCITYRDCGFNDHNGPGVILLYQFYYVFYR
jgi:hypothetical protein